MWQSRETERKRERQRERERERVKRKEVVTGVQESRDNWKLH